MFKEFKEFAVKGNVMDMAVGIIIGAAFGTLVSTFVDNVLMPPLGLLIGGVDFSSLFLVLKEGATPPPYGTIEAAKEAGAVVIGYGMLINALISFLIVAFVLFILVKNINRLKKEAEEAPASPETPEPPADIRLLTEIRDLLARQ
jgi:large conductance mechanosensitive channel